MVIRLLNPEEVRLSHANVTVVTKEPAHHEYQGLDQRVSDINRALVVAHNDESRTVRPKIDVQDFGYDSNAGDMNQALDYDNKHTFAGWYDAQCQGVFHDYCRLVGDKHYFSCALAGASSEYTPSGKYLIADFTKERIHRSCVSHKITRVGINEGSNGEAQTQSRQPMQSKLPLPNRVPNNLPPQIPSKQFLSNVEKEESYRITLPSIDPAKKTVAILIPMTSREMRLKVLSVTPLTRIVMSSLAATLIKDREKYNIIVYGGYDNDDKFWQGIASKFSGKANVDGFHLKFIGCACNSMVCNTNCIANRAYTDGAEYLYRINDDSECKGQDWITTFVDQLESFNPPNVGVVGPICRQGNTKILTHDFTHKSHLEVFNHEYYPSQLSNWFCDDWITNVYGKQRTKQLTTVEVLHHVRKTRYNPNSRLKSKLYSMYQTGKDQIEQYVTSRNS